MKIVHAFVAAFVLASGAALLCAGMGFGFGASNSTKAATNIEDTYMLEYRETADGKK